MISDHIGHPISPLEHRGDFRVGSAEFRDLFKSVGHLSVISENWCSIPIDIWYNAVLAALFFLADGFWAFLRWVNHPQTSLSDSTRHVATPSVQGVHLTPSERGDRAYQSSQPLFSIISLIFIAFKINKNQWISSWADSQALQIIEKSGCGLW